MQSSRDIADGRASLLLDTTTAHEPSTEIMLPAPDRRALRRPRRFDATAWVLLGVTGLAAALRYGFAAHAGFAAANDVDGPAYFAGAVEFVHGKLPYKDFVFVQPPAVLLLASPFALLSRAIGTADAFTVLRVAIPLVDVANVYLVGRLVRHRGPLAVLVAGGVLAVYIPSIVASRTLLLESLLDLACLLGLSFAFDAEGALTSPRRAAVAGMCLGIAVSIKSWGAVPLVIVLAWSATRPPRARRLLAMSGGAAIGLLLCCLPFFLVAPRAFVHDVILSQLGRTGPRVPIATRLGEILGIAPVAVTPRHFPLAPSVIGLGLGAVLLVAVAIGSLRARRWPTPLATCSTACAGAVFAMLVVPDEFPYHYPAFLGPFAALTLGFGVAALAGRQSAKPKVLWLVGCLVAAALIASVVDDIPLLRKPRPNDFAALVQATVPPGSCVVTDFTGLTIQSNRFVNDDPTCPDIVDPFGFDLAFGAKSAPTFKGAAKRNAVAAWRSVLERTNWVVLSRSAKGRIPLPGELNRYLMEHFRVVLTGVVRIFERTKPG